MAALRSPYVPEHAMRRRACGAPRGVLALPLAFPFGLAIVWRLPFRVISSFRFSSVHFAHRCLLYTQHGFSLSYGRGSTPVPFRHALRTCSTYALVWLQTSCHALHGYESSCIVALRRTAVPVPVPVPVGCTPGPSRTVYTARSLDILHLPASFRSDHMPGSYSCTSLIPRTPAR